jgi:membrane-associated phospholipid phosphatase
VFRLSPSGRRIYPFDRLFVGYCLLMFLLVLLLGRPLGQYVGELLFYPAMALVSLAVVRYVDETTNRPLALIRLTYPALLFTFFYQATGRIMHIVSSRFFDPEVTAFEKALLGGDPSLYIDQHLSHLTWANELFAFGYFSYYFMIVGFLLAVFLTRRDDILRSAMTTLSLAFFVSYLLFVLVPVESPRWFFASQYVHRIQGPVFRPMVDFVIGAGGLHGGGMPSSHVGVALVILLYCFRYFRPAGWILLPVFLLLAGGTVWGRFHYVSDVLGGIVIGVIPVIIVWRTWDRELYNKHPILEERKLRQHHAP